MGRWRWVLSVALAVGAAPAAADTVDAVASDYIELALAAQMLDPGQVSVKDPRPVELKRAQAAGRDAAAIERDVGALLQRLARIEPGRDRLDAMRWRSLRARLESLQMQTRPADAADPAVAEEVTRRFGFVPAFKPLSDYDAALERLDAAMPGEGSLAERIEAMKQAAIVPPDRVEPVFRAALAECRKRTTARLSLPPESIELQFPDDAMIPASAQYTGDGRSVITASRAVPANVDQLLQYACHEVYPGHHLHYVKLEHALYRGRGWAEFAVDLEIGPFIPVAEAVAEYGVGLAFPVEERVAFEQEVLYPLAGLEMEDPGQWRAFLAARSSLLGASATVTRDYLAGTIDRDEAQRLFVRYRLQTQDAANQLIKMLSAFGSYLIASDMGWYTLDRVMRGKSTEEQWRLLEQIESEPMLLEDVAALR